MSAIDAVGPLADLVRDMERSVVGDALLVGGAAAVTDTTRDPDGRIRIASIDETLGAALEAELCTGPGFVAGDLADIAGLAEYVRGVAVGVDDCDLPARRPGHQRRHHRRWPTGGRPPWPQWQGRPHGGQSQRSALRLRVTRLLGDRDLRGPRCCGTRAVTRATAQRWPRCCARRRTATGPPVRRSSRWRTGWASAVANLVNVVNPDAVVFGGSLRDIFTAGVDVVRDRLDTMPLPASREHLRLRAAALGRDAVLIGAAELAFDKLLADPLNVGVAGQVDSADPV